MMRMKPQGGWAKIRAGCSVNDEALGLSIKKDLGSGLDVGVTVRVKG